MMNEDPAGLLPELALLTVAVLGLLIGSWLPRRRQYWVRALAAAGCLTGLIATAVAAPTPPEVVFASYTVDATTHATRAIVLVAVLLVLGLSTDAVAGHRRETEFVVLVLLSALGTVLLAGATDLLLLFAAFLLASIPLYALSGWAKAGAATEAAMKYYLSGALAGVTMITGVTVLYGAAGTTGYPGLRSALDGLSAGPAAAAAVGLVAVLAGLAFKAGAVPAHFWVPDATAGTPPAVGAVLTTIPKIGALIAVYRLLTAAIPDTVVDWPLLVAVLAAASMTLGNLAAFAQTSLLRLLAYSTVSQVGYLLMAVAVAARTPQAGPALLFYLAAYALTNLGAFAVVAALPGRTLEDHRGLGRRRPLLAGALAVCLLGLVGTPPTAVFLGKLTVFAATLAGGMSWLVIIALINTVASLFYYLRWIGPVFADADPDQHPPPVTGPWAATTAVVAAAASLLLGIGGGVVPLLTTTGG